MTIELMQTEDSDSQKFKYILESSYIDPAEDIAYPPTAVSFGEFRSKDDKYPIPIGTYGNFSTLQAPPKSKKTFFASLIAAAYLGDFTKYTGNMKGFRQGKCLAHFDTEQGRYHAQKAFRRPLLMSGLKNECYQTFALRSYSPKERLEFIEWYLYEHSDNLGMVIIDGIADLCIDSNDMKESSELVQHVMRWTEDLDIHIMLVIHSNFGSDKMVGHLGSYLEKKAETVIQLQVDEENTNLVEVKCKRSRSYPFENFHFEINKEGLPVVVDAVDKMLNY